LWRQLVKRTARDVAALLQRELRVHACAPNLRVQTDPPLAATARLQVVATFLPLDLGRPAARTREAGFRGSLHRFDLANPLCRLGDVYLMPVTHRLRPRNRGRRTGRRLQRSPQRAWTTPLETLLLAERAALMTGRDEDFTMIVTIGYTGLRWGEAIGLERGCLHPGEIHVEWQLRELNGRFHRLPPKDDSYRSPAWEPSLPVDLPPFLTGLLGSQIRDHEHPPCGCAAQHGGSGRYLFLGPDGGHYRRSNYARRVFRAACDGRHEASSGQPGKLVIADATTWPGVPIAAWAPADPSVGYAPQRGRGIQVIRDDIPIACWLPIKSGLIVHGLRHGHKTWVAEDGILEILAEQRLGHQVPGMRGLYAHASDRMRDDLKHALQARWKESLRGRAAIAPRSPVPLLDEPLTAEVTHRNQATPGDREKTISQNPPNRPRWPARATLAIRGEPELTASDLARYLKSESGAKGLDPLTPCLQTRLAPRA
jgi:integrase